MFGKKKESKAKETSQHEMPKNIKERIISEVEQLAPGQSLIYKLPEFYWSGFAAFLMVELNPSYPKKGRKYILSTDKIADGKPAGKKYGASDSNKPKEFADWVSQFNGERFS